jgi:hypothetical protein
MSALRTDSTPVTRVSLVDAAAVADYLGVERGWVYEHAGELRARRLGSGPRARLRFSLADVDQALTSCLTGRESTPPRDPAVGPIRRRRRSAGLGTAVELLPIRGGRTA